ncbi:BTB/POZ domain-containing protein [Prunus yedoensis var. nudiflora]|uniref:BTB/POZ domain-containing protein n=1 Tax=Prunus yedoensis var. nudiflora TaxID=2094558 RepID=A0A314UIT1_PRUYE|nr:BTB/POZ domain-containing protein [Prunus yedoensis var. nudiflora]
MMDKKEKKFLTVAPFECAWRKDLKFREAGRGCVAFEASAHNDVTLVFRENVGSQHYHYKRDNSPHYTVILGSHRNRRLKIEVDGNTVVDVEGVGLCCSSAFQSYWISICDGLISIGKGRYPFQNLVFQWLDSNPNCSVRYVGLSSWDKHVGYRNVSVLPLTDNHISLWKHVDCNEYICEEDGEEELEDEQTVYEKWGIENFLESWELSDVLFIVGTEESSVPAHKTILVASGNFPLSSSEDVIQLKGVTYPVLHALLQYIYTGRTQIPEPQLGSLRALGLQFEVIPLVKQCEEAMERLKLNRKLFDFGKSVELSYPCTRPHCCTAFPFGVPVDILRLKQLYLTSSTVTLWSLPFAKMFTNGMSETIASEVFLRDISPEAFKGLLEFMYSGELNLEATIDSVALLLQLFLLADQYGVTLLHQECCKTLLEYLSEDSVCPILQVVSSIPSCKLIEETCEMNFSMHFDYCTTASIDFVLLDETTFSNIVQHPDLTVTSEEKVLNAILMWGCRQFMTFCPFVRFLLLPLALLEKLEKSNISRNISTFNNLVKEAINCIKHGLAGPENEHNLRIQHRRSSYKELQYICDGDSNGVLYFAGTSYGKHQWVNPVLAKRITITASSPPSRFTDPKALVSRTYQGTSFAGPQIKDGHNCTWWMVDISADHQLICNYYTLRQDGSRAYMRYWKFQGSLDGKTWTNLRVHENDQTICKPGQFASWPVTGPNALLPYRFFRVILTGPTTDASNPWNFCICLLELYGYFY